MSEHAESKAEVDISVLFITYNRSDLLEITFNAVRERMDFGSLRVEFAVSDNRSDEPHLSRVLSLPFDKHLISQVNKGLGYNCNKGIAGTRGRFILQIQDDCEFVGERSQILTALRILEADPQVGSVQLDLLTPAVPREERRLADGTPYLVYENDGIPRRRESGQRPYSDQPHLKRREFYEDVGPYEEGTPMSEMELNYQQRVACQTKWRIATRDLPVSFRHLGGERSFNPSHKRAKRLIRLYGLPVIGPIAYRLRPFARTIKEWCRRTP